MAVSRFERVLPFQHLNSNQSRCLQMADYAAHCLWQAAEYGKGQRLRELDPLWAKYGSKGEPWTAFLESEPSCPDHGLTWSSELERRKAKDDRSRPPSYRCRQIFREYNALPARALNLNLP